MKYKYTILMIILLVVGGLILNSNYYINKNQLTMEQRVIVEEREIGFTENTRIYDFGKHTEESVLVGYYPYYDWSYDRSHTYDIINTEEYVFEDVPNFEYGSIKANIPTLENENSTELVSINSSGDEVEEVRPILYYDVEVKTYLVDVYNIFGKYKYSYYSYTNQTVGDANISVINRSGAEEVGLD